MIAVGDIASVRHALYDAETLLEAFGKLIGGALYGRSIDAEPDVSLILPAVAGLIHVLHDLQGKGSSLLVGMGLSGHVLHALIESRISQGNGGIASVKEPVNGFALLKPCQGAVLPENGRRIGQRASQTVVAAHQCPVAKIQPLVKNLPESLHVSAGGQGHIHQINGHHSLVETAVEFIISIFILPGA